MKKNIIKYSIALLLGITAFTALTACTGETAPPPESLEVSVREILELPVCEQIYRDIVYVGEKEKVLFLTTTDKEVLFSIDIRIQAGIKDAGLIDIEITGTDENGMKTAIVTMPESEILLADADEKTIEQFFIKERGGDISRLEYYDEINRQKEELVRTAIDSGLLERADLNARSLVDSFLTLSGVRVTGYRKAGNEQ